MKYMYALVLLTAPFAFSSIIKKPPVKQQEVVYKDLPCSEQDQAIIHEIISTMAENGKLGLLFKQNHLREIGSYIADVHPLKFMSTIFKDPQLKLHMANIWEDSFKKSGFLGGLIPSLIVESDKGKLDQYIPDFADEIKVPAAHIEPFFMAKDWENLVLFLIRS